MEGTQDSIRKIMLSIENVFGELQGAMNFDKMNAVIIQLRKENSATESKNKLIAMLEDLLRNEERNTKKKKLTEKYGMQMNVELERRLVGMCNLSDIVEERGIERGIEIEKEALLIDLVQKGKLDVDTAAETCGITPKEFEEKLEAAQETDGSEV